MNQPSQTNELVNLAHNYLVGLDSDYVAPFLVDWPVSPLVTRPISPATLPVLSYLPELVSDANAEIGEIVATLKATAPSLCWRQTYSVNDFGAAFLEKYGWAELIGLRGPVPSTEIACGFLLLGPHIEYPEHSHEAEEVYIPLNAPTFWMRGHDEWVSRPAGVPLYHESWLVHAMRTEATPLLALYLWRRGDLTQKSRID